MPNKEINNSKAPLIEHLAELRKRLIYCVLAFLVGMILCFTVWEFVFNFLTNPICDALASRDQQCNLILIKLQEGFFVAIRISLMGSFILTFPFLGFQLWRFVAPGLYKDEKSAFLPFMIASPFMFLIGAAFAFFIVIPLAFDFFLGFQQDSKFLSTSVSNVEIADSQLSAIGTTSIQDNSSTQDIIASGAEDGSVSSGFDTSIIPTAGVTFQGSVAEYLTLTIKFILAFGVCFQLPVLLTLMGKAGLVTAPGLTKFRKYAVVGILILAAVVTPPDVITQVILFVVVYGLYEVSIWLVRRVERRRNKELKEQGLIFDDETSDDVSDENGPGDDEKTDDKVGQGTS